MIVEALEPSAFEDAIPELGALILDAVEGGSGVNFLDGATLDDTSAWWRGRMDVIGDGSTTVFVARDDDGRIVGSTLLARSRNQNSPYRAEIGKVIVLRSARRRGIARSLMTAAEDRARADGRWLLILDTAAGSDAEAFYRALGWHETGVVPDYAMLPDGRPWAATFFWKDLR